MCVRVCVGMSASPASLKANVRRLGRYSLKISCSAHEYLTAVEASHAQAQQCQTRAVNVIFLAIACAFYAVKEKLVGEVDCEVDMWYKPESLLHYEILKAMHFQRLA